MHPSLRILLLLAVIFASCTPQRQIVYMQDKQELGDELPARPETYRLNPGDILHVRVMSSDMEASQIFNIEDMRRPPRARATWATRGCTSTATPSTRPARYTFR